MSEFQRDFIGIDLESRGEKWETLQARVSPDEKRDIFLYCKTVAQMPFAVLTRLIWRRILNNYKTMPNVRRDEVTEIEKATDETLEYIPIVRMQRKHIPRSF